MGIAVGLCWIAIVNPSARGQDTDDTRSVKLSEPFTFDLSERELGLREVVKKIELHDEALRKADLEAANSHAFDKALDLLRYIPIKLGTGEGEDFLLPNYLTLSYREVPAEIDIFGRRDR